MAIQVVFTIMSLKLKLNNMEIIEAEQIFTSL